MSDKTVFGVLAASLVFALVVVGVGLGSGLDEAIAGGEEVTAFELCRSATADSPATAFELCRCDDRVVTATAFELCECRDR